MRPDDYENWGEIMDFNKRIFELEEALRNIGENCTLDWVQRLAKRVLEVTDGE
jgi:hypothetical protein